MEIERVSKIAKLLARRLGVKAAVYASGKSFDVMVEGEAGVYWIRNSTRDVFVNPSLVARNIRHYMKKVFAHG
ncbi:MAG: hypothetical protein U5N55_12735 [Cypionkella sp.]|nr:hypothetical protein [Cypionkella sp.]